ncbi:MAG: hypothetical protein COA78_03245 [Blastopirellula sp.]|nr:MAG: hypothetical protein COA78_03245 [Blastopirellula sp.]
MRYHFIYPLLLLPVLWGCSNPEREKARAQVEKLVETLDSSTNDAGVYIRVEEDDIKVTDPWGKRLHVNYSQGGVAESVSVRSAGPDLIFHTDDDIAAERMSMNMKGIGEGIKKNAEETAANVAKGVVKGTVEGVKDSVKDAIPFLKKKEKDAEEEPEAEKPDE